AEMPFHLGKDLTRPLAHDLIGAREYLIDQRGYLIVDRAQYRADLLLAQVHVAQQHDLAAVAFEVACDVEENRVDAQILDFVVDLACDEHVLCLSRQTEGPAHRPYDGSNVAFSAALQGRTHTIAKAHRVAPGDQKVQVGRKVGARLPVKCLADTASG